RVVGIGVDRGLKVFESAPRARLVAPPPIVAALEIGLVRGGIHGAPGLEYREFSGAELHADPVGDLARELLLERDEITGRSIVVRGPQVFFGLRADHLRRHADVFARPRDRAFHDRVDAELARDFLDRLARAL